MSFEGPSAAQQWADGLALWAIPQHILDAAPQDPFIFDRATFAAPPAPTSGAAQRSGSSSRAAEALPPGGSVLDVGCGGGAAAFALVPEAGLVLGTDRQQDMVDLFAETAGERGVAWQVFVGDWLTIEANVPRADVVVCHNVLYNVAPVTPFVEALDRHARRRVVVELTFEHPQKVRAPLWKHFWDLDRPDVPTADTALAAIRDAGFDARLERSVATERANRAPLRAQASSWCRQLCLPAEREAEMAELLETIEFPRERATIWWDVAIWN